MTPRPYKITLEQLRIAARRLKKKELNPCMEHLEKITNAMEAAEFCVRPLNKYLKELENCVNERLKQKANKKPGPMFYLNKYLDQEKHKKK